jgi:fatty-acyl-CoA synthase
MPAASHLSYSHGASAESLLGETIGDNLRRMAAAHGANEALVDMPTGQRWTYAQLDADTDLVALGLIAAGIEKGDRVGIWAPNCAEWALLQYGAAKAGAILVNINPAYRSHELAYVLRQSGTKLLVSAESFKASDYRAMIEEVRGDLPDLEQVVYIGTAGWAELVTARTGLDRGELTEREASLAFDDPINIQYTSGTTGFPKGATLTHHNILNNGYFVGEGCGYTADDRVCVPVPFYHCFGMVMGTVPASSSRPLASIRRPRSPQSRPSAARRCTACPQCLSPSWRYPISPATTCPACARASWPARRARSR